VVKVFFKVNSVVHLRTEIVLIKPQVPICFHVGEVRTTLQVYSDQQSQANAACIDDYNYMRDA
jgi:hypothetical protein